MDERFQLVPRSLLDAAAYRAVPVERQDGIVRTGPMPANLDTKSLEAACGKISLRTGHTVPHRCQQKCPRLRRRIEDIVTAHDEQ